MNQPEDHIYKAMSQSEIDAVLAEIRYLAAIRKALKA